MHLFKIFEQIRTNVDSVDSGHVSTFQLIAEKKVAPRYLRFAFLALSSHTENKTHNK